MTENSLFNAQLPLGLRLGADADLETFYPGRNSTALAALEAMLTGEGALILFLWGGRGSGKSHLLQAACRYVAEREARSAYLPLAEWTVLDPIMVTGWDALQCVCLDDIGCIAGRADWEQALFELCNALLERGGMIVAAGHAPPLELGLALADLASRLAWGPVFRLNALDDDERSAALRLRANRRGLELPEETAQYLLRRLCRDMNSLTTILDQLDRASLAAQRRLTVPFAKAVLDAKDRY
jgi:DnaA family protein